MIQIKTNAIQSVLRAPYNTKLTDVILFIEKLYPEKTIITDGYRAGDKGVHGTIPLRGTDIRSYVFRDPAEVEKVVNEKFQYDPSRPKMQVAIFHDVGRGSHIHLQVHPNTRTL
jgi:hypothetical protein